MGPGSRDEFDSQGSAAALEEGLMTGRGLRSRAPVAARDASLSPHGTGGGWGAFRPLLAGSPGMTAHTAGPHPLARLAMCLTRAAVRRGRTLALGYAVRCSVAGSMAARRARSS